MTTTYIKKSFAGTMAISLMLGISLLIPASSSAAGPTVRQGSTTTYGVLAADTITSTGPTTLSGTAGSDVGLSPGSSITESPLIIQTGTKHIADTAAATAKLDLVVAYDDLSIPTATALTPENLNGRTFTSGTYSSGFLSNSSNFILDAQGDSTAVFIFRAASTLITSDSSTVTLANGAQACNVYWQVGSSATLGVSSTFVGHIYALTSITANTGATIYGQLLARNGAVTLDSNSVINNSCVTPPAPVVVVPVVTYVPPQDSSISSINSGVCSTTDEYSAVLTGNFPTRISNVAVNGLNIAASRWLQSIDSVTVTLPASEARSFEISLYNGRTPLLPPQTFICIEPIAEVIPSETTTERGGELPTTGTSNYTILAAAAGLAALGGAGVFLRRRVTK